MAGGKQTPRARMINILYLVLLGLIALEAPANLLDAFKKIGDSLANSKTNAQKGIDDNYNAFNQKLKDEPKRAKPIYDTAQLATKSANELDVYVEGLKTTLIDRTGGWNDDHSDYKGRENVDEGNRLMIESGKGKELKEKINTTKDKLMSLLRPNERGSIVLALEANDLKGKTWEQGTFGDGVPMGAEMTSLIKIQSDIKNDEAQIQKKILGRMEQAVVTLDKFVAVAVAPSSYIIQGQPYKADIYLTAYDSRSNPDVYIDGGKLAPATDGKSTYTVTASGEGVKHYKGQIDVKGTDGTIKHYQLPEQTYTVAKPSAVVSPEKMNVLYIGVQNPLSVSAPGVSLDDINVTLSGGGSLSKTSNKGHYEAKVSTPGTVKVTITGVVEKGKPAITLGTSEFRVKRIPDPIAQFAGKNSGSTSAVNLRSQNTVFAHLDNFEFEAKFTVTHFSLFIQKPRQDVQIFKTSGANLSAEMQKAMAGIGPGTKVFFDDITAVGPDGSARPIPGIILTAN